MRITVERLREILDYDAATGVFRWRVTRRRANAGNVAGYVRKDGYRYITIDGRKYLAGPLAWFHVHSRWPNYEIDHKNTIRDDDRFKNLRDITHAGNGQNQRRAQRHNKTGLLGVSPDHGKFRATIWLKGKNRHLGTFATPGAAYAVYVEAKRKLHPGCTL